MEFVKVNWLDKDEIKTLCEKIGEDKSEFIKVFAEFYSRIYNECDTFNSEFIKSIKEGTYEKAVVYLLEKRYEMTVKNDFVDFVTTVLIENQVLTVEEVCENPNKINLLGSYLFDINMESLKIILKLDNILDEVFEIWSNKDYECYDDFSLVLTLLSAYTSKKE